VMSNMLQLTFDELNIIVKGFKDSGEDITSLHAKTRNRVHGRYGQWMGEAADKFYEDMEDKHLPSLARVAGVLFSFQDVLLQVIQLINE
ncbi:WXG100 family type VII secretion target, partial [Escherichia coli]|uniref:WXG100 family type VII secretion target n=1 Tax=Escherichia coli TaxID=562 RepID=UPI0014120BCF